MSEPARLFPRPKLAVLIDGVCRCQCHSVGGASAAENEYDEYSVPAPVRINGVGNRVVLLTDPIAAVCSCHACSGGHAVVFSGRPPELDAARPWNPRPLVAAEPKPSYAD